MNLQHIPPTCKSSPNIDAHAWFLQERDFTSFSKTLNPELGYVCQTTITYGDFQWEGGVMTLIYEDLLHGNYSSDLVQTSPNTGSNSYTSCVRVSAEVALIN